MYIIADETTDACGRCVLAILLQPVGKPPVAADLIVLDRVNFSTVSQAVISCLNSNNANFNDVWAFVTDSSSYMKKAYNTIIHGLFPNANHVTCLAYLLQLVLEVFPDTFEELNRMCALVKRVFCQSPKRHLELRASMAFSSKAVRDLGVLLEENGKLLKVQATFIMEHSSNILATLTKLVETSRPTAASIFSQLEDLSMLFEYGRTAEAEDWHPKTRAQLNELNEDERYTCSELFKEAMAECFTKLQSVMERHPWTELFKVLPIFDPAKVSGLKPDIKKYVQVVPSLSNVSTEEWHRYIRMDKSDAGEVSALEWWAAREDRMPTLAPLYLHLPTTSVDVERLFSHYSALLTEHKRSLTEENGKMMLIAKFNTRY